MSTKGSHPVTAGAGVNISTIEKTVNAQAQDLGKVALDWDALDFGGATPSALDSVNVAGTESADIDCEGASAILLKTEYSANNVTAPFWVVLIDGNATASRMYSTKVTPANTGENDAVDETGYYHGEGIIVPVYGAKNFRVVLADTPTNSGSVSVWAKAV